MSILTGSDLFGYNKEIIEKTFDKMEQNSIDFGIKFGNETSHFMHEMSKCCFNPRIQTMFDTFRDRCNNILDEYASIFNNLSREISETALRYAHEMNAESPRRFGLKITMDQFSVYNPLYSIDDQGNTYIEKTTALRNLERLEVISSNTNKVLDELLHIVEQSGFVNEAIIRQEIQEIQEFKNDITNYMKFTHKALKENIENVTIAVSNVTMGKIYANSKQRPNYEGDIGSVSESSE